MNNSKPIDAKGTNDFHQHDKSSIVNVLMVLTFSYCAIGALVLLSVAAEGTNLRGTSPSYDD